MSQRHAKLSDQRLGKHLGTLRGTWASGGWHWYLAGGLLLSAAVSAVQGELVQGACSSLAGCLVLIWTIARLRQRFDMFEHGAVHQWLFVRRRFFRGDVASVRVQRLRSRWIGYLRIDVVGTHGDSVSIKGLDSAEHASGFLNNLFCNPENLA